MSHLWYNPGIIPPRQYMNRSNLSISTAPFRRGDLEEEEVEGEDPSCCKTARRAWGSSQINECFEATWRSFGALPHRHPCCRPRFLISRTFARISGYVAIVTTNLVIRPIKNASPMVSLPSPPPPLEGEAAEAAFHFSERFQMIVVELFDGAVSQRQIRLGQYPFDEVSVFLGGVIPMMLGDRSHLMDGSEMREAAALRRSAEFQARDVVVGLLLFSLIIVIIVGVPVIVFVNGREVLFGSLVPVLASGMFRQ